jgi:ATP-dependent helicase/nuclease subunit A
MANFLKERQIGVISQTSLLLSSDEKVRFILALLKVIQRPDDRLAKSEALYLFYKVVKRQIPNPQVNQQIQEIIAKSVLAFYDKFSQEGYSIPLNKLLNFNLYEMTEQLLGTFQIYNQQSKPEYVFRLLDVILQFSLQKSATLADFLEYWEEKKNVLSINTPKDDNAVIVTTIHKSKGLEYPVVILPFADWSFVPRFNQTMWVNLESDIFEFNIHGETKRLKTAILNMKESLKDASVATQYTNEMQKIFIENMNMLYVAFTRAVERLYIYTKAGKFDNKGDQKGMNYLIFEYLMQKDLWDTEQTKYIIHQSTTQPKTVQEETQDNVFYIEDLITTDVHRKLRIKGKKKVK